MLYQEFIDGIILTRGQLDSLEEYHERHHIIPRCCGGTDDKSNLIDLLPEEHYYAHRLLLDENPEHRGLQQAFTYMSFVNRGSYYVTSEEYGKAKRYQSKLSSERMRGNTLRRGIPHTEETKKKLSEANKNYVPTEEARRKQSEAQRGRKLSEETKNKIREQLVGRKFDDAFRKKCSIAKLGNKNALGHRLSQESKDKIIQTRKDNGNWGWSEAQWKNFYAHPERHRWNLSEESKRHISEGRTGIQFSEEHRKHLSEAQKGKSRPNSGKYERTSTTKWKSYKKRLLSGTYFSDPHSPYRGEYIEDFQLEYIILTHLKGQECVSDLVPEHFIESVCKLVDKLGIPDNVTYAKK